MDAISTSVEQTDEHRTELLTNAEEQLLALVSLVARSKRQVAARMDRELTPTVLPALGMIIHAKRITQSEICEKLLIDKASISRMVSKLEERGMVTREVDQDDRRVSHLIPTKLAEQRWYDWLGTWRQDLRSSMNDWEDQDLQSLSRLLERLNVGIQDI